MAGPAALEEALACHQRGQLQEARRLYGEILARDPLHVRALHLLGVLAAQCGNPGEALGLIERALAIEVQDPALHHSRGAALQSLERWAEALASFERAAALQPNYADAGWQRNRGELLRRLQQPEAALAGYERAAAELPEDAQLQFECGTLLQELQRNAAALARYERAIALKPDFADAHCNRGAVLLQLHQWQEALASFNQAIALDVNFAEAYSNRGAVLEALGRWNEARRDYDRALALRPQFGFLKGHSAHAAAELCDWKGRDAALAEISARIERGEAACAPFPFLSLSGSARLQHRAAQIWVQRKHPPDASLGAIAPRPRRPRIRVAYFSPDFRDHAVAHLVAPLIEAHDRAHFEVTAFSFGPDKEDAMRLRLARAFERFVDVREQSDREIALLARSMDLDIAVDLAGFTKGGRPGIFALRPAPVQLSYLGYLGTLGAPYMDYLVADAVLVPPAARADYSEEILYLPSYQVNDARRAMAEKFFSREELGLPPRGFVFCCFNASYKITPATFAAWMRILARVPQSVLLLLAEHPEVADNLRHAAVGSGVAPGRLIFGGRLPAPDYMARYRAVDLFLDTLPYNAGTTASDALWAGLPVLTCRGESFAGRMGASLLSAIEMPELIVETGAQFEDLAVALAGDPARHAQLRQRLSQKKLSAPLFDAARFARSLEAAYARIHERHQAGLPPASG